jgi:hypothetical protein
MCQFPSSLSAYLCAQMLARVLGREGAKGEWLGQRDDGGQQPNEPDHLASALRARGPPAQRLRDGFPALQRDGHQREDGHVDGGVLPGNDGILRWTNYNDIQSLISEQSDQRREKVFTDQYV